jgi:hypothetical protein
MSLLDRRTLMVLSVPFSVTPPTTYKALKNWEYRPRGLRLAVFKNKISKIDIYSVEKSSFICPGIRNMLTYGKGGVVINLRTSAGSCSFLNIHLPFDSFSLVKPKELRTEAVRWQANCFNHLYKNTTDIYNPDYIIVMGDLNFRVKIDNNSNSLQIAQKIFSEKDEMDYNLKLISENDELTLLKADGVLPNLIEGVDNKGPQFLPTCKMLQGRSDTNYGIDSYLLGSIYQRAPSWCDRILYKSFDPNYTIKCIEYDRWECGDMVLSDHTSVYSIIELS